MFSEISDIFGFIFLKKLKRENFPCQVLVNLHPECKQNKLARDLHKTEQEGSAPGG